MIFAARIDLQVGTIGVTFPLIIGAVLGLFAGYYSRWPTQCSGGSINVVMAFPFLVLVLAIVAMLGPGLIELLHRGHAGQLGGVRPESCTARPQRLRPRVRARRPGPRLRRPENHVPAHPPERDRAGLRVRR